MYHSFNYRLTAEIFFAAAVLITTPLVIYGIFFNYASLWLTCTIFGPLDFIFLLVAVACWELDEYYNGPQDNDQDISSNPKMED